MVAANAPIIEDLIAIPGTWESSPSDDPLNPVQFPIALLLNVSRQTPPPGWLHAERPLLSKLDQLESWLQIRLGTKSLAP